MIMATKHAESGAQADPDTSLLIDVDLSILGEDEITFYRYEEQIRQEYVWVPVADYRRARAKILRRFLYRRIYTAPRFSATASRREPSSILRVRSTNLATERGVSSPPRVAGGR